MMRAKRLSTRNPKVTFEDVLAGLLSDALDGQTGKLRASDALVICRSSVGTEQIARTDRAMTKLGWEHTRCRFDGMLQYGYVKGNTAQREVELVVRWYGSGPPMAEVVPACQQPLVKDVGTYVHNMRREIELVAKWPRNRPSICQKTRMQDLCKYTEALVHVLGNRTGTLRVSDAFLICGIEHGEATQEQMTSFGRAIRELGWKRKRCRYNGTLEYAYVKGDASEREVKLVVDYDAHIRSIRRPKIEVLCGALQPTNRVRRPAGSIQTE